MKTVIKRWGNSLGIRIPNFIVKEFSLKDGSSIEIEEKDNQIIIYPENKLKLNDLLKKIDKSNIHFEIETGDQVGNEIW